MELFDVYSLFNVTPVRAKGCKVWDDKGQEYLDLYGGHAVISVGHCHPHYNEVLTDQLGKIGFYSIQWWYGTMILRPEWIALVKVVAER